MNATNRLEVLNRAPGVLAVALVDTDADSDRGNVSGEDLIEELGGCFLLYWKAREAEVKGPIRIRLGDKRAVLMMGTPDDSRVVAVIYLTRSAIVKSLTRMARSVLGIRGAYLSEQARGDLHA